MRVLIQILYVLAAWVLACLCESPVIVPGESHHAVKSVRSGLSQVNDDALWDRTASGAEFCEVLGGMGCGSVLCQTCRSYNGGGGKPVRSAQPLHSESHNHHNQASRHCGRTQSLLQAPTQYATACQYYVIALRHIIR